MIETRDGIKISLRHNKYDWIIVEEQFTSAFYVEHFSPPRDRRPVIVDVGGYIGDFTLWCAGKLDAEVVVYEPTTENWAALQRNLELNPQLAERVTAVNKGVSSQTQIVSNVVVDGQEVHASSALYEGLDGVDQRVFECDTLTEALDGHRLDRVDLLKVDCEGGEYDIFTGVPTETYARIEQIVLEWHAIEDHEPKLAALRKELEGAGYCLRDHDSERLIYAVR